MPPIKFVVLSSINYTKIYTPSDSKLNSRAPFSKLKLVAVNFFIDLQIVNIFRSVDVRSIEKKEISSDLSPLNAIFPTLIHNDLRFYLNFLLEDSISGVRGMLHMSKPSSQEGRYVMLKGTSCKTFDWYFHSV